MATAPNPFRAAREASPTHAVEVEGERIPLLLRMQDIRKACKNPGDFSSANPFHITLAPETGVRNFRQYPIESDPLDHTAYRAIVEPLFRRAEELAYRAAIGAILQRNLDGLLARGEAEIVREFALPVQCQALALLRSLFELPSAGNLQVRILDAAEQSDALGGIERIVGHRHLRVLLRA